MVKIIIAGSRNFNKYSIVEQEVIEYLMNRNIKKEEVEIISGGARGADRLGEQLANSYGLALKVFPAHWDDYGKKAGMIRNKEMAHYAISNSDMALLFAFWDGQSRGTKMMIDFAKQCGMGVIIRRVDHEYGYD